MSAALASRRAHPMQYRGVTRGREALVRWWSTPWRPTADQHRRSAAHAQGTGEGEVKERGRGEGKEEGGGREGGKGGGGGSHSSLLGGPRPQA
jgi:hypothetical protein